MLFPISSFQSQECSSTHIIPFPIHYRILYRPLTNVLLIPSVSQQLKLNPSLARSFSCFQNSPQPSRFGRWKEKRNEGGKEAGGEEIEGDHIEQCSVSAAKLVFSSLRWKTNRQNKGAYFCIESSRLRLLPNPRQQRIEKESSQQSLKGNE